MQIKDVHVIFHVLVTWFIQKSGEYAKKTGDSDSLLANNRTQLQCASEVIGNRVNWPYPHSWYSDSTNL